FMGTFVARRRSLCVDPLPVPGVSLLPVALPPPYLRQPLLILGDLPDAEGLAFAGGRVPQDERLGLLDVEVLGRVEGDRGGELVGGPSVVGPTVRVGHAELP